MSKPYYEMNPEELLPWLLNLVTMARARAAELPMITKEQIDALEDEMKDLQKKLNARVAAQESLSSAVTALSDAHESSEKKASFFNTVIKADKSLPRELLEVLGLPLGNNTNRATLNVPLDLTIQPQPDGDHNLKFDRNDNPRGTIFIFEERVGDAPDWSYIDSTTEAKYVRRGHPPGVQVAYRVKASHKGESSPWSQAAVVYFKG